MAQENNPNLEVASFDKKIKIAVVGALWNKDICDNLIANAVSTLDAYKIEHKVFRVAGSFELIFAADQAIKMGYEAVAIFGVIIRGETPHFEYVSQAVTQGATLLSFKDAAIGFGVLTCDTREQAIERSGISGSKENKGKDTIEALLLSLKNFK